MAIRFSLGLVFLALLLGYQNCAEEINIEELRVASQCAGNESSTCLCLREPEAEGCACVLYPGSSQCNNNNGQDNSGGDNSGGDNGGGDTGGGDNGGGNNNEPPVTTGPFLHSIEGTGSQASEDEQMNFHVLSNGDTREVMVAWYYRCPESSQALVPLNSSNNCAEGISCANLTCNDDGDISNQAVVEARLYFNGAFVPPALTKYINIVSVEKTVLNPTISGPTNSQLINATFSLSAQWSNPPSDIQSGISYTWDIPSSCSLKNGAQLTNSSISVSCSSLGSKSFKVSYETDDFRGSASKSVTVDGSMLIDNIPNDAGIGETVGVRVVHSTMPNVSYKWTSNHNGCTGSSTAVGANIAHTVRCTSMPPNNTASFTLEASSGTTTLSDSFDLPITKGTVNLSLSASSEVHIKGSVAKVRVATFSGKKSEFTFNWSISHSNYCDITGNKDGANVECDQGPGGNRTVTLEVSNENYQGRATATVKFNNTSDVSLSNCAWSGTSGNYQNAPGFKPTSWKGILLDRAPTGKVLVAVSSYHNNSAEDRKWNFKYCDVKVGNIAVDVSTPTIQTNWYNTRSNHLRANNKQNIYESGSCGNDKIITGKYGIFGDHNNDRGYKFYCSKANVGDADVIVNQASCSTLPTVNVAGQNYAAYTALDSFFTVACPANKVIFSEKSYHNHKKDDRGFQYKCCSLKLDR